MNTRYANEQDFDFIVSGLEDNRRIEQRQKDQIAATDEDKKELKQAIKNKNIRILSDERNLIGFLYFRTDFPILYIKKKIFWIDLIYVAEAFRGKGFGKLLYEDATKIAKQNNLDSIVIDIFTANTSSAAFHKKLGFNPLYTIYTKEV